MRAVRGMLMATLLVALASPAFAADSFVGNSRTAIMSLTVADESRTGYDRDLFRHWIDEDGDGCNTRYEVLIAEAVKRPRVGANCRLTGGRWLSAYDGVLTSNTRTLDIDHVVPLAEAWDSGAFAWTGDDRMRFANDLGDARALIAVSASSNRRKSDQDPAEWLPTKGRCTYLVHWVAVKVRWRLSVDPAEQSALLRLVDDCGLAAVRVTYARVAGDATAAAVPTEPVPSATDGTDVRRSVTPGAFCAPAGSIGYSTAGNRYTCKSSASESRNRWRR